MAYTNVSRSGTAGFAHGSGGRDRIDDRSLCCEGLAAARSATARSDQWRICSAGSRRTDQAPLGCADRRVVFETASRFQTNSSLVTQKHRLFARKRFCYWVDHVFQLKPNGEYKKSKSKDQETSEVGIYF